MEVLRIERESREMERERDREREITLPCSQQSSTRLDLKPGVRNSFHVSHMGGSDSGT